MKLKPGVKVRVNNQTYRDEIPDNLAPAALKKNIPETKKNIEKPKDIEKK